MCVYECARVCANVRVCESVFAYLFSPFYSSNVVTVNRCHSLQTLDLHNCVVPEEALIAIAEQNPLLESVDLTGCNKITDVLLQKLAAHCPQIRQLSVADCTRITYVLRDKLLVCECAAYDTV